MTIKARVSTPDKPDLAGLDFPYLAVSRQTGSVYLVTGKEPGAYEVLKCLMLRPTYCMPGIGKKVICRACDLEPFIGEVRLSNDLGMYVRIPEPDEEEDV